MRRRPVLPHVQSRVAAPAAQCDSRPRRWAERAKVEDAEVIWRDPESRADGELTDAMVK
jgi:hypothetical protein